MRREPIFRAAALEAQAYGEIGEPRIHLPRWMIRGALLLLLALAATVYTALTLPIELQDRRCEKARGDEAKAGDCTPHEIRPARDLLFDRSRGGS